MAFFLRRENAIISGQGGLVSRNQQLLSGPLCWVCFHRGCGGITIPGKTWRLYLCSDWSYIGGPSTSRWHVQLHQNRISSHLADSTSTARNSQKTAQFQISDTYAMFFPWFLEVLQLKYHCIERIGTPNPTLPWSPFHSCQVPWPSPVASS